MKHTAAFSLIELLIVLLLFGVLAALGLPALLNSIHRAKLTGVAGGAAAAMQAARLEAIKRSTPVRVEARFGSNSVLAYVDLNNDQVYTDGIDVLVSSVSAPSGIVLHGPGDLATANLNAIYKLSPNAGGGVAVFNSDGSVSSAGGFRFRDPRGNIMEVYVGPKASARISVRKYAGNPDGSDDPTQYFEANQGAGWIWQ